MDHRNEVRAWLRIEPKRIAAMLSAMLLIPSSTAVGETPQGTKNPVRAEVAERFTWDLTPLFATPGAWEEEFQTLQRDYSGIGAFRLRVGESAESLRDAIEFEKAIGMRVERLNQFAALKVTEDSSNTDSLRREARMESLLVKIGEAFAFLSPEIQAIPDDIFDRYLAEPILAEWTIPLRKLRRLKPHTLTHAEERLLALGSSVIRGHQETFSQLTNVDMRFGSVTDGKGRIVELTQSSFSSLLLDRNPSVRRETFHKFYTEFSEHQFTLASSLASSVRADVFHARARNYSSAREAALFVDDVPAEVYDSLIHAVRASLNPLFRYFELRRRLLGLDEIHHYDTYVPLVADVDVITPWDDAVAKVLDAVTPLGSDYVSTLAHGLGPSRWCDRYPNKGKRSGAFSYGTFRSPPYIMMNFKENVFADVYTLAHEAGHSMHTWYSKNTQNWQNYHYPIFLAEVASTLNEMLLTHRLLQATDHPNMRAYIISRQIDDLRGTLYRQTMFAEFEKLIHEAEESGEALTIESFKTLYSGLLDAYFGPAFTLDDELKLECLRIPHFYNAFYVYKYATGISAAVALAEQILMTGDAGPYLAFLRSGGSKFPLETLNEAGVDMSSPQPIEAALQLFAKRVDELEMLLS